MWPIASQDWRVTSVPTSFGSEVGRWKAAIVEGQRLMSLSWKELIDTPASPRHDGPSLEFNPTTAGGIGMSFRYAISATRRASLDVTDLGDISRR